VTVLFYQKISDFTISILMKNTQGKVAMNQTIKPCIKKNKKRGLGALMAQLDFTIPKISGSICPIEKGPKHFEGTAKVMIFPMYVPPFIAEVGTYNELITMKAKKAGKLENVVMVTKTLVIEDIDD